MKEWGEEVKKDFGSRGEGRDSERNLVNIRPQGRGRPLKWGEPTQVISIRVPQSVLQKIDELAKRTKKTRSEVVVAFIISADPDLAKEWMDRFQKVERIMEELSELAEAFTRTKVEEPKLKGPVALAYKLKDIIHEGLTWKAACEALGLHTIKEYKDLLDKLFSKTSETEYVPTTKILQGWVLRKRKNGSPFFQDFEFVRVDEKKREPKPEETDPEEEVRQYLKKGISWAKEFGEPALQGTLRQAIRTWGESFVKQVILHNKELLEVYQKWL